MPKKRATARNPKKLIPGTWTTAKVRRVKGRVQVKLNPTRAALKRAGVKTATRKRRKR